MFHLCRKKNEFFFSEKKKTKKQKNKKKATNKWKHKLSQNSVVRKYCQNF